ncbi:hypothetical protein C2S51_034032 [Perilla frutescens var. frutescens]|nr:hypothetical protein C2S51_034032 [Perilla frutescens var. frutescens]
MERARHRKTKSASGIEGIQPIQKQKTVPRLSSDSHSYIDGSNRDGMFMLDLGQSTLGRATGIPMKKLLAEEISKDVESKRKSPSVIARLMGLEGLPSPRNVHRQQKKFPENSQQKNVSITNQRNIQPHEGRASRRSSIDQQEFKDVYEDLEASHVVNRRCSSRWTANSFLTKPEMELIQQKFMDAKRLSTDEKFQGSKELDDTLEMLDSNKDLLLKFLGQSDSLFVKHLHDLQVDPGSSLGSHIAVLKPSNSEKFESKAKAWRSERNTSSKPHVASHLKREDGLLLEPHSRHRAYVFRNSSKIQVEETKDENILPTRIVVLKPNLGKMQNAGTSFSSPDISHGHLPSFKKIKEYPSVGSAEKVSWRRKDSSHNTGLSKAMSKEARDIAREITMRMRDGYDETMDAKSTTYRGYVGDDSSYDANESDSESDSEMFRLSSRRSFDDSNICRYPSSHLGESPVNMEAKKRLSERWKMTHKYQDLEVISRGSTLGEMLSLSDKGTRPSQLNAKMSPSRASQGLGSNNGTAIVDVPLGISSRDGWKDEIRRNSSRSRSLPPPTGWRGRSHRRSPNHDMLAEDRNLMHSDSVHCSRSKVMGNLSHRENYTAKDSKSRSKKSHPCQHIFANEIDSLSGANFEIQMEPNTKDLSEQQSMFPTDEKVDSPEVPVVDVKIISEPGSSTMSSKSSEMLPEQSLSTIAIDKVADHNQEGSSLQELHKESPKQGSSHLQCLGAEPESSESSKEADHPSPISVLEVPCSEDTPSSESFERVSAELHELRMQLKLLKMESGTYSETSALLPIEEEEAQVSPSVSRGNHVLAADSWRTCYVLDVLIDSGLEESDFNMFRTSWHTSNHPLDPGLFDKLEKKYNGEATGLRSERRLLFDRINSAILEIFEEHVNLCPWVMPKLAGSDFLQWQGIQDALERLIDQDEAKREISDRVLDREMLWSDTRGEMEILGNQIQTLLIDDLITEVICN